MRRRPLQHLHAAHRAAKHAKQRLNAQMVNQQILCAHHIGNGDDRKIQPIRAAAIRFVALRAGRAATSAQYIGANDEIFIGIDNTARPDHLRPPALFIGQRIIPRRMLVAGQRMANENGIAFVFIERAVSAIGQFDMIERRAAVELQGSAVKPHCLPLFLICLRRAHRIPIRPAAFSRPSCRRRGKMSIFPLIYTLSRRMTRRVCER